MKVRLIKSIKYIYLYSEFYNLVEGVNEVLLLEGRVRIEEYVDYFLVIISPI